MEPTPMRIFKSRLQLLLVALVLVSLVSLSSSHRAKKGILKKTISKLTSSRGGHAEQVSAGQQSDELSGAQCFGARKPDFTKVPKVHFYSGQRHVVGAGGCSGSLSFAVDLPDARSPARPSNSRDESDFDDTHEETQAAFEGQLLGSSLYDPRLRTYFIVHGFLESWKSSWMCRLKNVIQDNEPANVFVVDWSGGSRPMLPVDYPLAVSNTKWVAAGLARLVASLVRLGGQRDASRVHFIGHSLGAHVAGYVGYELGGSLGRITGLDPAGPCFGFGVDNPSSAQLESARLNGYIGNSAAIERRLSASSAQLVVAIHTDANRFGLREQCAHLDIYLNGGEAQPGCQLTDVGQRTQDLLELKLIKALNPEVACGHSFSHKAISGWSMIEADEQHKCYPMAYSCSSWEDFRAGECGLCPNDDASQCVYSGLSADKLVLSSMDSIRQDRRSQLYSAARATGASSQDKDKWRGLEDDEVNGEHWLDLLGTAKAGSEHEQSLAKFRYQQHFIKSTDEEPNCLYHYQLLIAVRVLGPSEGAKFYVEIPLPPSSKKQVRRRLARVSHLVALNSRNHQNIEQTMAARLQLAPTGLRFYSALITFKPDQACMAGHAGRADSGQSWTLCGPLEDLANVRVYADSDNLLRQVQWLGLNFMSAMEPEARRASSFVFVNQGAEPQRTKKRDRLGLFKEMSADGVSPLSLGSMDKTVRKSVADGYQELACRLGLGDCKMLKSTIKLRPIGRERPLHLAAGARPN